jgi:hypothetical protein
MPTGINQWWNTNADSLRHANSDVHGLRAADALENSLRGNQHYGQYTGPSGNAGSFKGDVARSIFFLAIRYNDLEVVNGFPDVDGELGDLATLLSWHQQDPPDDFEMNRNNIIYDWQKNRNPFIDYPELVDYIWGSQFGNVWNEPLSTDENSIEDLVVYPNPTINNQINIDTQNNNPLNVKILDVNGRVVFKKDNFTERQLLFELNPGLYLLKISNENSNIVKKLLVK